MKKSTIGIFVGIGVSILAITLIPGLVKYLVPPVDTSSDPEPAEPVYHRVEAEKYELVFPETVNTISTIGRLTWSQTNRVDIDLFGLIEFFDEDCMYDDVFNLAFSIITDGYLMTEETSLYQVAQGEYGRYVISETQVADEPVAYTLEPIYEYVLVE